VDKGNEHGRPAHQGMKPVVKAAHTGQENRITGMIMATRFQKDHESHVTVDSPSPVFGADRGGKPP